MSGGRAWTEDECRILAERWPTADRSLLAREMGRSIASLRQQAHRMHLKRSAEFIRAVRRASGLASVKLRTVMTDDGPAILPTRPWTWREIATLRAEYRTGDLSDLAERLGRSFLAIEHKAFRLGLQREVKKRRRPIKQPVQLADNGRPVVTRVAARSGDAKGIVSGLHHLDLAWSRHGLSSPHGQPAEPVASVGQHTDRRAA